MDVFKKVAGWFVSAVLFIWASLPKAMDWVGRSTLPDDWDGLMSDKLPEWAAWLFSTPSWVPAILAIALTAWLMWVSWPRQDPAAEFPDAPTREPSSRPALLSEVYEGAHEELMLFSCMRLIPTCGQLLSLQERAIRMQCENGLISNFAVAGGVTRPFREHLYPLHSLCNSPPTFIPFDQMIDHVHSIEQNYSGIPTQISLILREGKIPVADFLRDNQELYEAWQENHALLVAEYDAIKLNSKMGRLFRPARPNRWRDAIIVEA